MRSAGSGGRNLSRRVDLPPEPHLRLIGDLMEYTDANMPRYKPLSVSGYHIREAGATAAQELAFTLARWLRLTWSSDKPAVWMSTDFAPGLSFFFDAHIDFFEEIAKFRAARRIWARWLRDRYGATTRAPSGCASTADRRVSLTAAQPDNNVVRTAVEAMAAVLGGTNSLHTNALDEVLALPSEKTAEIARACRSLGGDRGSPTVADPLGGSWYIEALTDRLEGEAERIFARIEDMGGDGRSCPGCCGASRTATSPAKSPTRIRLPAGAGEGDKHQVRVTVHTETIEEPLEILRIARGRKGAGRRAQSAPGSTRRSRSDPESASFARELDHRHEHDSGVARGPAP